MNQVDNLEYYYIARTIVVYNLSNIVRPRLQWYGHVARMRKTRNDYRIYIGNPVEDCYLEKR
jgi:hypothetical protein